MPLKTFRATVNRKKGLAVEAESRGFKMIGDEPEDLGGANTGMNPSNFCEAVLVPVKP